MNTPFPPSPFPVKGATPVQPQYGSHYGFHFVDFVDSLPPRGGPSEAES
jgi:hypothetical protein